MPFDPINPFRVLAEQTIGKIVTDSWTASMLGLWQAGLWVLSLVLRLVDTLTTPDLSEAGPGALVYRTTFWLAGVVMIAMLAVQLGLAAFRRSGKSLVVALVGAGKFAVVWAGWIGYATAVVVACGAMTKQLLKSLLRVDTMSAWQPWSSFQAEDITDAAVATVLGLMGLLLWLAAIGHLLVMITRAGALIVLVAMTPVSAAGLLSEVGQGWFWKSFRWFHAAAFTPVLMVMMLGVGVQLTDGTVTGPTGGVLRDIGTALTGIILILVACFAPLALFKLLAFTDPSTSSGAAFRTGLAAAGGVKGILSGGTSAPSGADSSDGSDGADGGGGSAGEASAEDATEARFTNAAAQAGSATGPAGSMLGAGLTRTQHAATRAASVGSDLTNQMGVGHATHQPDQDPTGTAGGNHYAGDTDDWAGNDGHGASPDATSEPGPIGDDSSPQAPGPQAPGPQAPGPQAPGPQAPSGGGGAPKPGPTAPGPTGGAGGAGGAGSAGGAGAASGAAGGAAGGAAAVPIVPV